MGNRRISTPIEPRTPAVLLTHLTKSYAAGGSLVHALQDCTLSVESGTLLGLFGPNGAGKSSLIRLLCTLVSPSSGTASVCGYDIVRESLQVRRCIALVSSDERTFHGRLTAQQNLAYFAALYDLTGQQAAKRIAQLLFDFGISSAAGRPVQTFSSGMRQRLSMVRALLHDPPVLLLDEPTSSLDLEAAAFVRHLVKDELVGSRKKTVIYATHDLYEMDHFCDLVAILNRGRLVAQGSLDDLAVRLGMDSREPDVIGRVLRHYSSGQEGTP